MSWPSFIAMNIPMALQWGQANMLGAPTPPWL
jgi:hypothetical protein